jgi:hypothetical protein
VSLALLPPTKELVTGVEAGAGGLFKLWLRVIPTALEVDP